MGTLVDTRCVARYDPTVRRQANRSGLGRLDTQGLPGDLARVARRKLRLLAAAAKLDDLRQPPGDGLETLVGKRAGQHSIRVNDQWRLGFIWRDGKSYDVGIVDYHGR